MNRSTRIKACVLSVVFTAVLLLAPFSPVHADSFPSAFYVNGNSFYSASQIYVSYMELNEDQKLIAQYLLGMYNLAFLGSRGFAFSRNAYTDESSFIAKIKAFGSRLFNGAAGIALQSRMDDEFLKYCSAVLLYASQCNTDFDTWFENLDDDFTIPVDQGILNSFNILYNDNSDFAIEHDGDVYGEWESGLFGFDMFPESEYNWVSSSVRNNYNNFLNSYDHVVFADRVGTTQSLIGSNNKLPNTLFILRGDSYSNYRFGYDDNWNLSILPSSYQYYIGSIGIIASGANSGKKNFVTVSQGIWNYNILTAPSNNDLSDFINYIFSNVCPIPYSDYTRGFVGYYPYIEHVILVDNLNTLYNPVEVFNTDSWDIFGLGGNMIVPIDNVNLKPKVITSITLPDNTQSSVPIRDIISDDNVVDDNDSPVDPWQVTQVVQPNDTNPISIDVNLFSGGSVYLDYLWEHTRKVVVFAKDILDCFEFEDSGGDSYGPKFAIYGVLVLGVAGGMIAKFLL